LGRSEKGGEDVVERGGKRKRHGLIDATELRVGDLNLWSVFW